MLIAGRSGANGRYAALSKHPEVVAHFVGGFWLLFAAYMLTLAAVIDTNAYNLPAKLLYWLVLPTFVGALGVSIATSISARSIPGTASPGFSLLSSAILWTAVFYLMLLVLSTSLRADIPADQIRINCTWLLRRSGEITIFLCTTAFLTAAYPNFVRRFFVAMVCILSINAVVNVAAFLSTPMQGPLSSYRLYAVFGTPLYQNATHLAPMYAIFLIGAIGLVATSDTHRWEKLAVAVSTAVLAPAIALTQARGSFAALAIGGAIIALALPWRMRRMLMIAAAVLIAVVFLVEPIRTALFERGDSFRFALWREYIQLAMERPWIGYGYGRELNVTVNNVVHEQPHNSVIWAFVRGGLPCALAAAVLFAGPIYWSFRYWRQTRNVALLATTAALGVTSITEIGLLLTTTDWLWITFWLPVGLGAGAEIFVKQSLRRGPMPVFEGATAPDWTARRAG